MVKIIDYLYILVLMGKSLNSDKKIGCYFIIYDNKSYFDDKIINYFLVYEVKIILQNGIW
jgi:hypothetical protein